MDRKARKIKQLQVIEQKAVLPVEDSEAVHGAGVRNRVNISVPDGVLAALQSAAGITGMTLAQVTLSAVVTGLPGLFSQVDGVQRLRGRR